MPHLDDFLSPLFEVVYHDLGEERFTLLHELEVLRMVLIFILSLFTLESNVQRYLVRLINNVAMASHHLSNVKVHDTRDRCQVFLGCGDQLIRGVGRTGVGPKDNDV